jgi:hypothetical protein
MALTLTPASDPAYLAFLRSSGVQESQTQAEAQRRISQLQRGLARRAPGYAEDSRLAQRNIGEDFEGRGLYDSGRRMTDQADAAAAVGRRQAEDAAQTGDSISDTSVDAATTIARLRRDRAEQELQSRTRIGLTDRYNGVSGFVRGLL